MKAWTPEEDSTLEQLVEERLSLREIMARMNRTIGSIKRRIIRLDLVYLTRMYVIAMERKTLIWNLPDTLTTRAIAKIVGIDHSTAWKIRSQKPKDWVHREISNRVRA